MQTESMYRKVKAYLSLLEKKRLTPMEAITDIVFLPCDYKTSNELPPVEAFLPFEKDQRWGNGKDSHAWFHFTTSAHPELNDKPLYLHIRTEREGKDFANPQFLIYVDGAMRQGLDTNHREILLDPATAHEIYLYAYTGGTAYSAHLYVSLFALDRRIEKLWYDIRVPFDSLAHLEDYSNEYQNILAHLYRAVSILNMTEYETESEAFFSSVEKASRYMDEVFYGEFCGQRENAPKTVCIGATHIDCAWLWTLKQTREKVQRSFSTVVELMERYPEYRFMASQPLQYRFLQQEAPDLYEKVKQLVREGRWECEGAMWVEADCNLSSGESLVRQVLYGKRFFRQEFGVDSRVLWLPDVFGYSAALPQILKKSGVEWFITSKISWNDINQMPYDTFEWRGIDGTGINSYFMTAQRKVLGQKPTRGTTYNGQLTPSMTAGTFDRQQQKALHNEALLAFGFGDGGGGPTADHLEQYRRLSHGIPGTPKTVMDFAGSFFSRLEEKLRHNPLLPVWRGELYLEYHRGTYTTIHKNKKNNRRSEFLYLNTEWLSSVASILCGKPFPKENLRRGWEMLLTNQFHDIIPGSSIPEVYEQSDLDYSEIRGIGEAALADAGQAVARGLDRSLGYVVFNPNSTVGNGTATLNGVCSYVENVPPKGYCCVKNVKTENTILVTERALENRFYRLTFDERYLLTSIYDKRADREVLRAGQVGNQLRVYADYPDKWDAWEWTEYSAESDYDVISDLQSCTPVQDGVRAGFSIVRSYRSSTVRQTVWLYEDLERIDFETDVDWHQHHQMLKVAFPVDINAERATYDIQYGSLERPTHKNTTWDAMKFEVCAHKFADLSEGNYGVSLLNDCKYGHDIHDGVMMLSLLRSPMYPTPNADQGRMECVYALVPHAGALELPRIAAMAYALNNPMQILPTIGEGTHLPTRFSVVESNRQNIVCEVVKEAEDSKDLILRLYENGNSKTVATLLFGFPVTAAFLCDMQENELRPLELSDNTVTLPFGAFEIHTLKIKRG